MKKKIEGDYKEGDNLKGLLAHEQSVHTTLSESIFLKNIDKLKSLYLNQIMSSHHEKKLLDPSENLKELEQYIGEEKYNNLLRKSHNAIEKKEFYNFLQYVEQALQEIRSAQKNEEVRKAIHLQKTLTTLHAWMNGAYNRQIATYLNTWLDQKTSQVFFENIQEHLCQENIGFDLIVLSSQKTKENIFSFIPSRMMLALTAAALSDKNRLISPDDVKWHFDSFYNTLNKYISWRKNGTHATERCNTGLRNGCLELLAEVHKEIKKDIPDINALLLIIVRKNLQEAFNKLSEQEKTQCLLSYLGIADEEISQKFIEQFVKNHGISYLRKQLAEAVDFDIIDEKISRIIEERLISYTTAEMLELLKFFKDEWFTLNDTLMYAEQIKNMASVIVSAVAA